MTEPIDSTSATPTEPSAKATTGAQTAKPDKVKDRLERSLVWFALGMVVAGGVGAIGFLKFVEARVKAEVQSPEVVALVAKQTPPTAPSPLPRGALVLFGARCPEGWEDLTSTMNGRYLYVDQTARENVQLYEDDGSHQHDGGGHQHRVTGQTGPLGGGERSGTKDQTHSAHKDNVVPIIGTALPDGSSHTHTGGSHQHKRVGLRLCKA
jgi:hypothetical protein